MRKLAALIIASFQRNDFHIYKMIPKRAENIADAILEAINELDAIIVSLEDLKEEYNNF